MRFRGLGGLNHFPAGTRVIFSYWVPGKTWAVISRRSLTTRPGAQERGLGWSYGNHESGKPGGEGPVPQQPYRRSSFCFSRATAYPSPPCPESQRPTHVACRLPAFWLPIGFSGWEAPVRRQRVGREKPGCSFLLPCRVTTG